MTSHQCCANNIAQVEGAWHLGFGLQLAWFCLDVLFSAASIMNLCAISVYRYLAIAYPYRIRYAMSRRHVVVLLLAAWGISFLVSMAVLVESLVGHARARARASGSDLLETTSTPLLMVLYSAVNPFVSCC